MIDQSSEEVIINFKWRQQQTPGLWFNFVKSD
jgi:hypothetical protein